MEIILQSTMSRYNNEGKVYVGDLPRDATESELDRAFSYYGPIRNIWISRHPAGFAFIEFEDIRDAEDSVRDLNGSKICGVRARVEMSNGGRRSGGGGGGGRYGGGGAPRGRPFDPNDRCYQCGERGHYAYDCRSKGARGGGRRYSGEDRGRSRFITFEHDSSLDLTSFESRLALESPPC